MKELLYLAVLLFSSCTASQKLIYFENTERDVKRAFTQQYDLRIQKDDLLSITVSSKTPELATPFNLTTPVSGSISEQTGYLVDSQGNVMFPILGKIYAQGFTLSELASNIEARIIEDGYFVDPTVNVKLLNFKISVLGEVKSPGLKKIESGRITILDAIGLAGDLTIYGVRDNVSLIRETNGQRVVATVDLTNDKLFSSEYYYLNPNDIIYVQPNKKQQKQSSSNPYVLSTIFSGTSLLVTIIALILRF